MSVSKHLQDKLALLPDSPGCYIMKDENQNILYVGKAKVLKNRVRSYFHGTHNNKTTRLVSHIRDFEFIVTGSEKEALLLEINLIKKHTPPYNIMFMDDKTYPYIEITKENNFVVRTTRNIKNKKSEYFGPYPSSQSAYEIVKLINQIFCVRKCRHIPDSPCLYYHMHQCLGPCIHEIDPKENESILDCCAAPGTKTMAMAERMHNQGHIDSYDLHAHRKELIESDAKRLGIDIVHAGVQDATTFKSSVLYDRILCDVPCSGYGVLSRKPDIKLHMVPEDMDSLIPLQYAILNNVCQYVKVGGVLVYSTCTMNKKENEKQIEKFLSAHEEFSLVDEKTIFSDTRQDGFYMAKLVRK